MLLLSETRQREKQKSNGYSRDFFMRMYIVLRLFKLIKRCLQKLSFKWRGFRTAKIKISKGSFKLAIYL